MSDSKALAVRPTAIIPTDYDGFGSLAERFAKSNLIPQDLRGKAEDVFVQLLAGHELGLTPMASLRGIHVVKGKPILSADTMVALVLGRGAEYFICVEESDTSVTYETKRIGVAQVQRATWTWKDAERALLVGGDNWKKYPRQMLKARCKAVLARDVYPDVLAGCYEETERDEIERPAAPFRPHVVPDPTTGEIEDAEVVEPIAAPTVDTWAVFLREIEHVVKDDTADWSVDDVAMSVVAGLDNMAMKEADDFVTLIGAALDRAGTAPAIVETRTKVREAYKARRAAIRKAEKAA